ncbi:MAG TPA: hypothetical protein VD932_03900 [Aquabacterium sp.]|nr:hypothetical protein [Aquabacterium sp.]
MSRRLAYPIGLILAAGKADRDAPRTPYAAAKESQARGFQIVPFGSRQYLNRTINGEGLAILRSSRGWPLHPVFQRTK